MYVCVRSFYFIVIYIFIVNNQIDQMGENNRIILFTECLNTFLLTIISASDILLWLRRKHPKHIY